MRKKIFLAFAAAAIFLGAHSLRAANSPDSALTGQVSSAEEGMMEGVLVSAKRAGSTITITVVSDSQGRYTFPAAKLEPGQYSLNIRAARIRSRRPRDGECRAGKNRCGGSKVAQNFGSRGAAD